MSEKESVSSRMYYIVGYRFTGICWNIPNADRVKTIKRIANH